MLLSFNYYNTDLLELNNNLQALSYVDDTMVIAVGKDFEEATEAICEHMEGKNGGFKWSADHNSKFKINKLVIMHLGHKKLKSLTGNLCPIHKPKLLLQFKEVKAVDSYRYLGIVIDNKLTWRKHKERVIDNATKRMMQCH